MAMYWPEQGVAFDIIDDPLADHVPQGEGWNVVYATLDELQHFESYDAVMKHLAHELGIATPEYLAELDRYESRRRALFKMLYDNENMRNYVEWAHEVNEPIDAA